MKLGQIVTSNTYTSVYGVEAYRVSGEATLNQGRTAFGVLTVHEKRTELMGCTFRG